MKVMTFNIQGQETWQRLGDISNTISNCDADVVLLQEVMRSGATSQANIIKKSTSYPYMCSTITRYYQSSKSGKNTLRVSRS